MTGHGDGSLRSILRQETRDLHDMLDARMGHFCLDSGLGYRHFLQTQYRARQPIEAWLAMHMPAALVPPAQCPALLRDLHALDAEIPPAGGFMLPAEADPIGLLWTLAGSAMGNRVLLARRRKANAAGPEDFLAGNEMAQYFKRLRPQIEREPSAHEARLAVIAANAVFRQFLAALPDPDEMVRAA